MSDETSDLVRWVDFPGLGITKSMTISYAGRNIKTTYENGVPKTTEYLNIETKTPPSESKGVTVRLATSKLFVYSWKRLQPRVLTSVKRVELVVDGQIANVDDLILVKNLGTSSVPKCGIYKVIKAGGLSSKWVMIRLNKLDDTPQLYVTDGKINEKTTFTRSLKNERVCYLN